MDILSALKFFFKMRIVSPIREFFLSLHPGTVNRADWENRMLLINLQALGDLILFTSVLPHYKKAFPQKKIFLLIPAGLGIEPLIRHMVDEIITVDYRRFAIDPWYGARFIRTLRAIGFQAVAHHDFSAAEIMGKIIATDLHAERVIAYAGLATEWQAPFDFQQAHNLRIVRDALFPKCTAIVPSIDSHGAAYDQLPSAVRHYAAIYEYIAGTPAPSYATSLIHSKDLRILQQHGLAPKSYVALGVGSRVPYKRWPAFRFSKIAELAREQGLRVVLLGARGDRAAAQEFLHYFPSALDLTGRTNLSELVSLIEHAQFLFTNDTSLVHFAVALKTPSVCVTGGGHFGMFADYGYSGFNRWVFERRACFFDGWRCARGLGAHEPAPCLAGVSLSSALSEVRSLLQHLPAHPLPSFSIEFQPSSAPSHASRRTIIYAGIRAENYDPERAPSFEYERFYGTLRAMPDIQVIEYPYDAILSMGRERFNRELLSLVESERPDLFFAFMLSDELDPAALDAIKQLTTSVAWFADDSWRVHNYSRVWAPHFTHAITTTPYAPAMYAQYGIHNTVLSQWATDKNHPVGTSTAKTINVSFIGQRTAARAAIIEALRVAGIQVLVRGLGWPEGRVNEEEAQRIIASSKICLNLNDPPSLFSLRALGRLVLRRSLDRLVPSFDFFHNVRSWRALAEPQIKARPFELAGAGAFVISGYASGMERYYREGEEMVFYRDSQDLIERIRHYLARDGERERIARAGQARTLREHTYTERFTRLFREAGVNRPQSAALVSIIIPGYNAAAYVREAVDSALHQTYPHCEVVVVDDGSTDNTRQILAPYIRDNKIVYIHQANRGLAGARNAGIRAAKGEYIAFLDADDLFLPEKIREQVRALEAHPDFGVCYSDLTHFADGNQQSYFHHRYQYLSGNLFEALLHTQFVNPLTVMVRRNVFDQSGFFDETLRRSEDWDLWLRWSHAGVRFFYLDRPLAYSRILNTGSHLSSLASEPAMKEKNFYLFSRIGEQLSAEERARYRFDSLLAKLRAKAVFAHLLVGDKQSALRWADQSYLRFLVPLLPANVWKYILSSGLRVKHRLLLRRI